MSWHFQMILKCCQMLCPLGVHPYQKQFPGCQPICLILIHLITAEGQKQCPIPRQIAKCAHWKQWEKVLLPVQQSAYHVSGRATCLLGLPVCLLCIHPTPKARQISLQEKKQLKNDDDDYDGL